MDKFSSLSSYIRFAFAREYVSSDTLKPFTYEPNRAERWGRWLVKPLLSPVDGVLKNIRNPLVVTGIVVAGLALATLVFYPFVFASLIQFAEPIRFCLFVLTESTILGIGLRALGRLNQPELMDSWARGDLIPVALGSEIVRIDR